MLHGIQLTQYRKSIDLDASLLFFLVSTGLGPIHLATDGFLYCFVWKSKWNCLLVVAKHITFFTASIACFMAASLYWKSSFLANFLFFSFCLYFVYWKKTEIQRLSVMNRKLTHCGNYWRNHLGTANFIQVKICGTRSISKAKVIYKQQHSVYPSNWQGMAITSFCKSIQRPVLAQKTLIVYYEK